MQKPFYHAFTIFTDTLQIDAYSNRFHLPPEHITRYPVITRCSHINRLHTFADISQFTFFQQSPEMTIRRSPCHAAYFLKIITKHYVMIGEIFLQPHIYPPPTKTPNGAHTYSGWLWHLPIHPAGEHPDGNRLFSVPSSTICF